MIPGDRGRSRPGKRQESASARRLAAIQAFMTGAGLVLAGVPFAGVWTVIALLLGVLQVGVALVGDVNHAAERPPHPLAQRVAAWAAAETVGLEMDVRGVDDAERSRRCGGQAFSPAGRRTIRVAPAKRANLKGPFMQY